MPNADGEPIDGLVGLAACCFVLTLWIAPGSGAAAEGYLVLAGLTTARAARYGLTGPESFPRFAIWRTLRFAPSLLAGLALYVLVEAVLIEFQVPHDEDGPLSGFIAANPAALLPAAALGGALLYGGAQLGGVFTGRPGRARLVAAYTMVACLGIAADFPTGSFGEAARCALAALLAGLLLESVNASGRVARGMRRLKEQRGDALEAVALTIIVALFLFADGVVAVFAPLMLAGCFLVFLRKRHLLSLWLASRFGKALGAQASPMIASAFLVIWPFTSLQAAGLATISPIEAAICAPVVLAISIAIGRALRRLVEDPARDFALNIERRVHTARAKAAQA